MNIASYVYLLYLGPPHITYYSGEMTAFEGNRVDMVCTATHDADANIPVQINWYNSTEFELIKPDGKCVMVSQ